MHQVNPPSAFPAPDHNHAQCMEHIIERAKAQCLEHGTKLTKLREAVLRAVAASHSPVGAYEIIDRLAKNGRKLAPISVYRILDVLAEVKLIHRLDSRNAFFICHRTHKCDGRLVFLVCEKCNTVADVEGSAADAAIETIAKASGFKAKQTVIEISGLCKHCIQK